MKNIFLIGLIMLFAACTTTPGYHIQGTVNSDFEGIVYLKKQVGYSFEIIDSTKIENHSFNFSGVLEIPDMYGLSFEGQKETLRICLQNTEYQLVIGDKLIDATITGGTFQPIVSEFKEKMGVFEKNESELINKIWRDPDITEEGKEELYPHLAELREQKVKFAKEYIHNNNNSPHTPRVLDIYIRNFLTIDQLDSVYQTFTEDVKNSNLGSRLGNSIRGAKLTEVGKPFVDFTVPGVDGKDISLSEIVKENKLVFIDFWASWCGPCRAMIPHLKELYEKYNVHGMEILAVSYDDDRSKWLQAIEEENFAWINVSNLLGWNCPTAQQYAIRGIPANVLINQDGVIVAKKINGQKLEDKIVELLELGE